jgi:glycine cleavage system H protein
MSTTRYAKSHEWIRIEGDIATVGISPYAQQQLGDVVYVELPQPGATLARGKEAAVVESVKAASEVYAPVSGTVIEANGALADDPSLVNQDAGGSGWFFKLKLSDTGELDSLLDEDDYTALIAELE